MLILESLWRNHRTPIRDPGPVAGKPSDGELRTAESMTRMSEGERCENLVVTENITVDGVIDQAKGWFQPVDDADDPEMVAAFGQELVRLDLPDEYRLFVYPVAVGGGADYSKLTTVYDDWGF